MTAINEIVDLSMIALRHMGLPVLEILAIKVGEFELMEFRLYFFRVPTSPFCLILCLCHAILMEKHKYINRVVPGMTKLSGNYIQRKDELILQNYL